MTVSQTQFRTAMLDATAPVPEGLNNPQGDSAGKRFDVYRNNVAVGLTEALENAFPVIRKLVGDEFFKAMSGIYLRNHPPSSPLMMYYGDAMPGFLKGFEPVRHLAYLPDMARLELALRQSYHEEDATGVDAAELGALDADKFMQARMTFAPAVKLLSSKFPVHGIWTANTKGGSSKIEKRHEDILITRRGYDPVAHFVERDSARCIAALMEGQSLAAAMALGGETLDLGATLALFFSEAAIISIN